MNSAVLDLLNSDQESMNCGVQRSKVKRSDHEKIKDQKVKKAEDQRSRNDQLLKKIKDQVRLNDQRSTEVNTDQKVKDQRRSNDKDQRSTKIKESNARIQEMCGNNVDNIQYMNASKTFQRSICSSNAASFGGQ